MSEVSTAVHEAGHAVLTRYFKMMIECVAVSPACGLNIGDGITKAAGQPSRNEDRAVIFLAGFAAECQHSPGAMSLNDFRTGLRYAADRTQLDKVMHSCLPANLDENKQETELDKLIEREFNRALELVTNPELWRAIVALSERLVREPHQLTGEEAMLIIDAELERTQ